MKKKPLSAKQLDALVEEATVDCYDEAEQLSGLYCLLEENLSLPFETEVLGQVVNVTALEQTGFDIAAKCCCGAATQLISLQHLPVPEPPPRGAKWIYAYQHWAGGLG